MPELLHIKAPTIVVGDVHRHVINLARVASHPGYGRWLIRELRRVLFHPDTLRAAQRDCAENIGLLKGDSPLHPGLARSYFIAVWMGRSAMAGTKKEFRGKLPVRWTASGGDSATRYWSAVRSLAVWKRVFQRCNFVVEDCFAFIGKVRDISDSGLYCDPPFPDAGDNYKHRFTEAQHRQLAGVLAGFESARIVCRFYDHALIRELYPEGHWTWRRLVGRKQSNAKAPEVLLINGPSYAMQATKTLF
jgi:hypothetical protein